MVLPDRITCPGWCAGGHDLDPAVLDQAGFLSHSAEVATAPVFTVRVIQEDIFADPSDDTHEHRDPPIVDVRVDGASDGNELTTQQATALAAALTEAVRLVAPIGAVE